MNELWEKVEGGIWGLLVGDALGVPFEFCHHASLPELVMLDYELPRGYAKSHAFVPVGTWSDDGAQALCLLTSMLEFPDLDLEDFADRLLRWYDQGYLAVDGFAFDVGNQTSHALNRLKQGVSPYESGLSGNFHNGNGSLMRCLPISLLYRGSDEELIELAHRQSLVTHSHKRSLVCCALYCLWARYELRQDDAPWESAVAFLRDYYSTDPSFMVELEDHILAYPESKCHGGSYVVDTLHSARIACREDSFEGIIKRAIQFGNDTDTVAAISGGIGGIRHRMRGIPFRWKSQLRGLRILFPILQNLCLRYESPEFHLLKQPINENLNLCVG
jgi:ADP-ribosyl-[dinitrogen reductase] hydrolase